MQTYWDYRTVKVLIAEMLMDTIGWVVYEYKPDYSDLYTDYLDTEDWSGIAEKNGYILCVNVKDRAPARKLNYGNQSLTIPAHMANPPRCNWHIEKDGGIVAKGNGILKFAQISRYNFYKDCLKRMNEYRQDSETWFSNQIRRIMSIPPGLTAEEARKSAESAALRLENEFKLCDDFRKFIQKIDRICSGQTENQSTPPPIDVHNVRFRISEDVDTRDNSKIYLVKVVERLSKNDFIKVNDYIQSLGGYYSHFKHAFLFRNNPTDALNIEEI